jgi:hypothetical protein
MRVDSVSIQGVTNDCNRDMLAPDERVYCTLQRMLTETDFISTTFAISADGVSGIPHGLKPLQGLSPVIAQLSNPNVSTALLTVSVTASTTVVDRAGDTVMYTITLVGEGCVWTHTFGWSLSYPDQAVSATRHAQLPEACLQRSQLEPGVAFFACLHWL